MRADITKDDAIPHAVLELLGNKALALPFLAVFPCDKPDEAHVLQDFNQFNPGGYRSKLFKLLTDCPDPPARQTALAN